MIGARPQFHFTAREGWINDPHGLTAHAGGYDLFFQFVPSSRIWRPDCRWGHARGVDLVSFTEVDVALEPGDGDDGIWTGSLVAESSAPQGATIFYTAVAQPDLGIGRVRRATPGDPHWATWHKGDVVIEAPSEPPVYAFRDPFVFADGDTYRALVGGATISGDAVALGYASNDLQRWTYEGPVLTRSSRETEPVWMGALWECPQLVDLGEVQAIVTSVWDADVLHYAGYAVGQYRDGAFQAQSWGRLSYGESHYAPSFFRDTAGRACLLFWMRGVADPDGRWTGAHSVPYVISADRLGLRLRVHPDLEAYRSPAGQSQVAAPAADIRWVPDGPAAELDVLVGSTAVASAQAVGTDLHVAIGNDAYRIPGGAAAEIRAIVDGPLIEIVTCAGIIGGAIPPGDRVSAHGTGHITLWGLARRS